MVLQRDVQVALGSVAERGQRKGSKTKSINAALDADSLNSIKIMLLVIL